MKQSKCFLISAGMLALAGFEGCAHNKVENVPPEEAAKINRRLVRNAVSFGPGAENGAVVPDVSSPCLRAEMVDDQRNGNKLIERHREWTLSCDVQLMSIPREKGTK